jgi:hypothetical protein
MECISRWHLAQVKAAILQTLLQLLCKGGVMMKPFLPQLQTIYIKALAENRCVGVSACAVTWS